MDSLIFYNILYLIDQIIHLKCLYQIDFIINSFFNLIIQVLKFLKHYS